MAQFSKKDDQWKRRALKAEERVAYMQGQNDIEDVFRYLADNQMPFVSDPDTAYLQAIIDGCWEAHLTMKRAKVALEACMRIAETVMAHKDTLEDEIESDMDAAEIGIQVRRIKISERNKAEERWPTNSGDTPEEREQTFQDALVISDYTIDEDWSGGPRDAVEQALAISVGTGLPIQRVHRAMWMISNDIEAHEAEYGGGDDDGA